MIAAPLNAVEAKGEIGNGSRLGSERGVEEKDAVAYGGFAFGIASVGCFDPRDSGRLIVAPGEFAGAGVNGVVVDWEVVDKRRVVEKLDCSRGNGKDFAAGGKAVIRLRVREGFVQCF